MVTIFNRRELVCTWSMKKQADIRNILASNNIDYSIKVTNIQSRNFFGSTSRARTGSFGINSDYAYQYQIYVKKDNFETARYLINDVM